MTLVISAISRDWVIQVSDRRLVWLDRGVIRRADDERNKAVLWCSRLAFAYTGLAELGTERRTDLWLANSLTEIEGALDPEQDLDQGYLLHRLGELSSEYFSGPRMRRLDPELRRHAFVAVGWARFDGLGDFSPYIAVVSNFHREGEELAEAADHFELDVSRLSAEQDWLLLPVGYRLGQVETRRLGEDISGTRGDILRAMDILAVKVRQTAEDTASVGKGLMINVLPRSSLRADQAEHVMLLSLPQDGAQTFLYVSPDDEPPGVWYGPTFVCGGRVMTNFSAESL